ncbi:glycosyltransferase [Microbacterium sediminicola]|uniref:Glycosyltransferase n=1 Tax=Microbacterium sediminicola TaxID=415210 RepID=A0ABP4TKP9_9MICO
MTVEVRTVVARVVFPGTDFAQTLPLYIDEDASAATIRGRHTVAVTATATVSLGSYFNAFPAAVWAAETDIDAVRLTVSSQGPGMLRVWKSDGAARATLHSERAVQGTKTTVFDIPLAPSRDGGALWLDLIAGESEFELVDAHWSVDRELAGTVSVAMATFNRPDDCTAHLAVLASDAALDDVVDRVVVVDQGTDHISDAPRFDEVAGALGERLEVVRQANLGGSGGFSRGMLEALRHGDSTYVLLLDDDAVSEPEAIFRAVRFADAARDPLLVGGAMLHLDNRSVLYTQSEHWNDRIGWVERGRAEAYNNDFSRVPFRETPYFHALQRADFNGWWMCLIPLDLIRRVGLSLPLFLKGDDVEFALRARENGVRTVSPPGIALWHMGWEGKAPNRTWEAYFLHRNRLITELLHAPKRRPLGVIAHCILGDLKPLLSLQYSSVRLRALATADALAGPERLHDWSATRREDVRKVWQTYPDAQFVPIPAGSVSTPPAAPEAAIGRAILLARTVLRQLFVSESDEARPARIAPTDLGWWTFAHADAAYIALPGESEGVRYQRSRRETRRALRRTIGLYARLWWRWPALSRTYRAAAPQLSSPEAWADVFGIDAPE